ncbi:MAG TPA: TetR/AcrR family transcriptional regulator [Acidimicrobiia bacterium]
MGRPREHDESTATALLQAAEVLIAEEGPDGVSVRGVSEAAGTSTRAVYSLFGSRQGLLEALAARGYHILIELVDAVPQTNDPFRDLVSVGSKAFRTFAIEHPHLFRLTFERVPSEILSTPEVKLAAKTSLDALLRHVDRALDAGVITGNRIEIAYSFHALSQGLAGGELSTEPPPVGSGMWSFAGFDMEQVWESGLTALMTGMSPTRA